MQRAFNLDIPQTLEDACNPVHIALLVYDMQVGIFSQAPKLQSVVPNVSAVLKAARDARIRTFFSRHMSLPNELAGVSQLRTAMAWQRVDKVEEARPRFLRGSPGFSLIPEMRPQPNEAIFDKVGMSFFTGTPLDAVLRDCAVNAFIIIGVVLEIGIAPTIDNAVDLGYIPIVVSDACGSVNEAARERTLADITYNGTSFVTDTATVCRLLDSSRTAK